LHFLADNLLHGSGDFETRDPETERLGTATDLDLVALKTAELVGIIGDDLVKGNCVEDGVAGLTTKGDRVALCVPIGGAGVRELDGVTGTRFLVEVELGVAPG